MYLLDRPDNMKFADLALVPPLLFKAYFKTFRTARKVLRARRMPDKELGKLHFKEAVNSWGESILGDMRVHAEVKGEAPSTEPCIFVGNHMSYLDILLLYSIVPANFVAKSEILKWPIIGKAAALGGTIFVKRNSKNSKLATAEAIVSAIRNDARQIVVFPEGTTSLYGKTWRRGVFKIAHEYKIPVQAFSLVYEPARRAAYIDKDHFFPHFSKMLAKRGLKARIEFHKPMLIEDLNRDPAVLENWSLGVLRGELEKQGLQIPTQIGDEVPSPS